MKKITTLVFVNQNFIFQFENFLKKKPGFFWLAIDYEDIINQFYIYKKENQS